MRVVLAEEQVLPREGMVRILERAGCEIAAAVASGPELARALAAPGIDVAVVGLRLCPDFSGEGLECALAARWERPALAVLVVSDRVDELCARELLGVGTGGVGYLLKDQVWRAEQFVAAVREVASGGTAIAPQVTARLLDRYADRDRTFGALTPREQEVIELMARGRSNAAIAAQLLISDGAVAKYTSSIFGKLGLPPSAKDNRRVLAVLSYLEVESPVPPGVGPR